MKIICVGDLFLGGDAEFKKPEIRSTAYFSADLRIANLEHPISEEGKPEDKSTLYSTKKAIEHLKSLKINVVNLANNHIHDLGGVGLKNTTKNLRKNNIRFVGAGYNLNEAQRAVKLTDNLYILGFCDFDKKYLSQVKIATPTSEGVNPLRLENVKTCLRRLPVDAKVILYIHWGKEHVWFPPASDRLIMQELLRLPEIVLIIGSHAHQMQPGYRMEEKTGFFCLGNFLFSNFHIKPRTQILPRNEALDGLVKRTTSVYHSVKQITYKTWRLKNRISYGVEFDTVSRKIMPVYYLQDKKYPVVKQCSGWQLIAIKIFDNLLSIFYRAPTKIYGVLQSTENFVCDILWNISVLRVKLRHEGMKKVALSIWRIVKHVR